MMLLPQMMLFKSIQYLLISVSRLLHDVLCLLRKRWLRLHLGVSMIQLLHPALIQIEILLMLQILLLLRELRQINLPLLVLLIIILASLPTLLPLQRQRLNIHLFHTDLLLSLLDYILGPLEDRFGGVPLVEFLGDLVLNLKIFEFFDFLVEFLDSSFLDST